MLFVQFKVEIVTECLKKTKSEFLSCLAAVRKSPSSSTVERVINQRLDALHVANSEDLRPDSGNTWHNSGD